MNSPRVYEVIFLYCFCFIICFNSYLALSMCSLCGQIPEIYLRNREKAHKDSIQKAAQDHLTFIAVWADKKEEEHSASQTIASRCWSCCY